jgi:3-oxoacyl-[acyl-carrier-protein] synthase-3
MDGREIFRRAVRTTIDSAQLALERAGVAAADVDLFVPHQANQRIIDAVAQRLGIPDERVVSVIGRTGNTSAASIPLGLVDAADAGRVADGDTVLLAGFGAGMSSASAVITWGR